jgi:hypothetical protein
MVEGKRIKDKGKRLKAKGKRRKAKGKWKMVKGLRLKALGPTEREDGEGGKG